MELIWKNVFLLLFSFGYEIYSSFRDFPGDPFSHFPEMSTISIPIHSRVIMVINQQNFYWILIFWFLYFNLYNLWNVLRYRFYSRNYTLLNKRENYAKVLKGFLMDEFLYYGRINYFLSFYQLNIFYTMDYRKGHFI